MKYDAYKKRFDKFLTKYKDLCSEYEEIMNDNISEYEYDIYQLYEKSLKINKQSVLYTLLQNALYDSINSEINILDSINNIINKDTIDSSDRNITQTYFNEVQQIYNKYNHDYDIEYSEENRDKLIEMNLKSVISIAKRYQGLGLSLNELISAGNLGLCVAFEKFDPSRAKLKENMIEVIKQMNGSSLSYMNVYDLMKEHLSYGNLKEKWEDSFRPGGEYTKEFIIKWIDKNVVNAKFNSVANMWIRAFILIEIDNNSRVVKKPKIEINKDRDISGTYQREKIIDIDSPISLDNNMTLNDVFFIEDETKSEMEINELYISFKQKLNILLDGVKSRDRSILLKKFGIGLPRPLLPKEIAEQEGLSSARVTQIFQNTLKKMMENAKKFEVDEEVLYDIINNIV
jgi:DNA-directed RNA polymerase sigma subunit (sigma70/sigma32)